MAFLKTILIILLIYYALKSILRYFSPSIIRYITKKVGENFQRGFETQRNSSPSSKNGEVTIDKRTKTSSSKKKVGEYIDFEEID